MNKYRKIIQKIINIGFIGLLIAVLTLTYEIYSDRKDDRIQSIRIELLTQQLEIQKRIATVQSKMATAQSSGGLSSTHATAIAEEYRKLKGTQVALATQAAELDKKYTPQPTTIVVTNTPTVTDRTEIDPVHFIRHYYDEINNRHYKQTWAMLSNDYKNEHNSTGFDKYVQWWETIEKVSILDIKILNENEDEATIYTLLRYYRKDGKIIDSAQSFRLVFDPSQNNWTITTGESSKCKSVSKKMKFGSRAQICTFDSGDNVNLRLYPSINSIVIAELSPGTKLNIISQPICDPTSGWWFWKVRTLNDDCIGWIAEGGDEKDPNFLCPIR